jgi:hypothetical protein
MLRGFSFCSRLVFTPTLALPLVLFGARVTGEDAHQKKRGVSTTGHNSLSLKEMSDSVLGAFWIHFRSITLAATSILCMFAWLIFPVPRPEELTEIAGTLTSYSVEPERTPFGRTRSTYVLFSVQDHAGRFWSDSVTPTNVTDVFPRSGLQLHFYAAHYGLTNGDGQKVYGLSIEGRTLQSVEDGLARDTALADYVMPAMGIVFLALAVWRWSQEARGDPRGRV